MKRGFTLVEILIAMSLFTLSAMIASTVLVDVVQLEKKSAVQTTVYEDVRILLQQLTNEVQAGTLDYDEYYNMYVIQNSTNGEIPTDGPFYGINHGVYASRFYDPGRASVGTPQNPDDLGVECSVGTLDDCEIYFTASADYNVGQNPYNATNSGEQDDADALCDDGVGKCAGLDPKNVVRELYLIDSTGTKKTIIGRKRLTTNDWSVGLVRMEGQDLDQNGFTDVFACTEEFECYDDNGQMATSQPFKYGFAGLNTAAYYSEHDIRLPQQSDLDDAFDINTSHFIPISPMRLNVKDLKFIIDPIEDPYKAYAEDAVQSHPSVIIILTVGLTDAAAADYPGEFPDITVQTTVSAGVSGQIASYPPVNDVIEPDGSWIRDALPAAILSQ